MWTPRLNGIFSRNDLSGNVKDGAYIINFDGNNDIKTQWAAYWYKNGDASYSDNFRVDHIPKDIESVISHRNVKANIFRIPTYD